MAQQDSPDLHGVKVAILVCEGFEQVEMTEPRKALQQAGAQTHLVSQEKGQVQAFKHHDRADKFDVDRTFDEIRPEDYDAVLLPGGALNADTIRSDEKAQQFVRAMQHAVPTRRSDVTGVRRCPGSGWFPIPGQVRFVVRERAHGARPLWRGPGRRRRRAGPARSDGFRLLGAGVQVEAAIRTIGSRYPYDDFEHQEVTLRGNHDEVGVELKKELQARLATVAAREQPGVVAGPVPEHRTLN